MKIILFIFLAYASVNSIKGQIKISGEINDSAGKPFANATVFLNKAKDSSIIKIAVTNKFGIYEFDQIKNGRYFISVTAIGYLKAFSKEFILNASLVNINVTMIPHNRVLDNISINAKKSLIESKVDKIVLNVDALPTSAGSNSLDMLEKLPGVTVNSEGTISLQGKAGVIVLIDGRQTFLSGSNLENLLKSIPSAELDQIEIITNPSAKYDASGNSAIINIKTKKSKSPGFTGYVTSAITSGLYSFKNSFYLVPKFQNSLSFNFNKKKMNFFGTFSPSFIKSRYTEQIITDFNDINIGIKNSSNEFTTAKQGNNNYAIKLGGDYYLNKKNIIGVVFNAFNFLKSFASVTTSDLYNAKGESTSIVNATIDQATKFKNFSSNFNFRHLFDSSGTELVANVDYVVYQNTTHILRESIVYDNNGQIKATGVIRGLLPIHISIYSGKVDYTRTLPKHTRIDAGIKLSYIKNDNLTNYELEDQNNWIPDGRSDHFIYQEKLNAVYINLNRQIKKWKIQGGLRLENTTINGNQITNSFLFKRNFSNLFPSAFVNYSIDKKNQITLQYSRRIVRPSYLDLNPFVYIEDSLSFRQGNPLLLPQFTNNIELKHTFKDRIITTLNYNTTTDVISHILKPVTRINVDTSFITANIPENVAKLKNIGLSVVLPARITKWWNTNLSMNVFNSHYKGLYNNIKIDLSYTSSLFNFINTFSINKKITAELSGVYAGKNINELVVLDPYYYISCGAKAIMLEGRATFGITMRDPFAWQKFSGVINYGTVNVNFYRYSDLRRITLSFLYRYGKKSSQTQRSGNKSVEELSRVVL